MARVHSRTERRKVIHTRIRKSLAGTTARPRLAVWRSTRNVSAQVIDDSCGRTLVAASTLEKGSGLPRSGNVAAAKAVGALIAARALEQGIAAVVFDRGGFLYHGAIKALAEAAREKGLKF